MEKHNTPLDAARQVLKHTFGFDEFRPGQEASIHALLDGRNVLSVMPTGSGKSLCFQIPALVNGGLTVVVSPLLSLMQDQVTALRVVGVAAETINSSQSYPNNVAAWRRVSSGETRLLYMAPERLMTDRMLAALQKLNINLFVIDEAHCISQWGPSFRPEYQDLCRLRQLFPEVPVAALTATADEITRADMLKQLFDGKAEVNVLGFDRPNIRLSVSAKQDGRRQLLDFLNRHIGDSGIVYCLSRKKTEQITGFLSQHGFQALPYHAGMDQSDRDINQNRFMTEPGLVIVATIAFGMGIDKSDVRFILHADMPGSMEAYYQEIGRAGRDGMAAEAHMLFGFDDIRMRRLFIEQNGLDDARNLREHKRLDALISYCEAPACRRRLLLTYFGEQSDSCDNCDLCLDPVELQDGTTEGQQIASAIYHTGQRFGVSHIIDVLRGTKTAKVTNARHDQLAAFGVGTHIPKKDWRSLIRQFLAAGFLHLDIQGYGGLKLRGKGLDLLEGRGKFSYRPEFLSQNKPKTRSHKPPVTPAMHPFSPDQAILLDKLKELRLRLARQRGVPAYIIFTDRSLLDMVHRNPQNRAEFAEVNGVGDIKLQQFAEPFLAVLSDTPP